MPDGRTDAATVFISPGWRLDGRTGRSAIFLRRLPRQQTAQTHGEIFRHDDERRQVAANKQ